MENKKFDKKKYDINYCKEHYKQFKVNLKKNEYDELISLLKIKKINKTEFVRNSISHLKKSLEK